MDYPAITGVFGSVAVGLFFLLIAAWWRIRILERDKAAKKKEIVNLRATHAKEIADLKAENANLNANHAQAMKTLQQSKTEWEQKAKNLQDQNEELVKQIAPKIPGVPPGVFYRGPRRRPN